MPTCLADRQNKLCIVFTSHFIKRFSLIWSSLAEFNITCTLSSIISNLNIAIEMKVHARFVDISSKITTEHILPNMVQNGGLGSHVLANG